MKKIGALTLTLLLSITLVLTGCSKKDESKTIEGQVVDKENPYIVDIDYQTLKEATDSKEDSFIVFFYEEDSLTSKEVKKVISKYANKNKTTLYTFNIDNYVEKYMEVNKDDIEEAIKSDIDACVNPVINDETEISTEEQPITGTVGEDGEIVSGQITENEFGDTYNEVTNENVYNYTQLDCVDISKENYKYIIINSLLERYGLSRTGSLVFMDGSFRKGSFENFLPISYVTMDEEAQKAVLDESTDDLNKWLDDIFSQYSVK